MDGGGWVDVQSICSMAVAFMVIFFPIISGGPTRMVCTRVRLGPRSPGLGLGSLRFMVCWHSNSERTHDQGDPPLEVTFDNAREHDGAGVPCVLQGMGILYFALAANFWWLALCINVFEMVFLGRSLHVVRKWHLFYHIFAWGAPLLGVIIVLAGTVCPTHQPTNPPTHQQPLTQETLCWLVRSHSARSRRSRIVSWPATSGGSGPSSTFRSFRV